MTDSVEVRLGATVDPATSAMEGAASSVEGSLRRMSDALNSFSSKGKSVSDDAVSSHKKISDSIIGLHETVVAKLGSINSAYIRFRDNLVAVAGVIAGGTLGKKAVDELLGFEQEVRSLQITMGMTSDKATQFAVALKLAGSSSETYEAMAQRVGRVLRTQSEEFDRLKVVTKDSAGNLLPMDQILQNVFTRMQDFKAGTDQMEFALSTVGRNAKDFAEDMLRLNEVNDRATQIMKNLGIEMGPTRQAQIEQFRIEFNAFKITVEQLLITIGENLLPRLMALATWINGEGASAINYLVAGLKSIATVVVIVGDFIGAFGRQVGISIGAAVTYFGLLGQAVQNLINRDWAGLALTVKASFDNIKNFARDAFGNVVDSSRKAADEVEAIWRRVGANTGFGLGNRSGVGADSPIRSGKEHFTPKPTGGGGAAPSAMTALNAELDLQKGNFEAMKTAQGSFQEWSLEQTRNYWAAALLIQGLANDDRVSIEQKYWAAERALLKEGFAAHIAGLEADKQAAKFNSAERIRIAEQEAHEIAARYGVGSKEAIEAERRVTEEKQRQVEQRIRLADVEQKSQASTAKFGFDMARMSADQQVALHQISAQQRLAIEKDYLTQEFAAEETAMKDRIALMANDPNSDPVKLAQLKAQLLTVEQNYQKQLTQIDNEAVKDRMQFALQADDAVRSSLSSTLASLASGAKSFKQTLLDAAKSLSDALNKIAADQIVKQFFGAGTSGGDFISKITGAIFGGKGGAADASGAAALSAAGASLSASGLSLDAAALALQSAAAALSMSSMTSGNPMGSAFGGGQVGDMWSTVFGAFGAVPMMAEGTPMIERTGLAVVHRGEAVIPATMNRGGMGGNSIQQHNTFYTNGPMDTRSQAQVLADLSRTTERASRRNR